MPMKLIRGHGTPHEIYECIYCGAEAEHYAVYRHRCPPAAPAPEKAGRRCGELCIHDAGHVGGCYAPHYITTEAEADAEWLADRRIRGAAPSEPPPPALRESRRTVEQQAATLVAGIRRLHPPTIRAEYIYKQSAKVIESLLAALAASAERERALTQRIEALEGRQFPIMDGPSIPWFVIAPWEQQAKRNHGGQTLERLAERGGLGASEALCVLRGEPLPTGPFGHSLNPAEDLLALANVRVAAARSAEGGKADG